MEPTNNSGQSGLSQHNGPQAPPPRHHDEDTYSSSTPQPYEMPQYNRGTRRNDVPPRVSSSGVSAQNKKTTGMTSGRMFLFGFLGALIACVVCLGAYSLFFGGKGVLSSTYVGSKDPTVINAVEQGYTVSEAVAEKVLPSVVSIYNYQDASSSYFGGSSQSGSLVASGMGSGVVISDDGYIITNYHVVDSAKKVTVSFHGEEREARYVGGDKSSDIAVVKVEDTDGLVAVDIGDSDSLRIGQWVMAIGAPLGLEGSVSPGVVSATNRSTYMNSSSNGYTTSTSAADYTYYPNMIQTDAVINPGNSGGALVDADGKLVGINSVISSYSGDYAGVGFAIPINYAIGIATDIINGKTPTHAMLGVSITTVNSQTAQRYGLSATSGAYINAITPGTGAANSGLQAGDIITAIDGTTVASATDVTLEVRSHSVGSTVVVTVNRDGATQKIDVVLSSDELASSAITPDSSQIAPNDGSSGRGNSGGYGISQEELEQLLRMFGF